MALLVRELQLGPDDVVADLGCGTGRVASLIAPYVAEVVALDYSETVLGVARERRGLANIEYRHADLNVLDTATLPVTKAYAVGALFYLDSHDVVRRVVRGLVGRGAWVAVLDLPDAREEDQHARNYDRSTFTHLRFDPAEVVTWFPGAEVQPWPDDIGYVHQAWRVNLFVRP